MPLERWAGLRERVWSAYKKSAVTASQEDPALRAAGILEPVNTTVSFHYSFALKGTTLILKTAQGFRESREISATNQH